MRIISEKRGRTGMLRFKCQPAFFPSTQQSSISSGARYNGDPLRAISLDLMVGYLKKVEEAG